MKSICPVATLNDNVPLVSDCWLIAPASKQPAQPLVFWSVDPDAVALTALTHATAPPLEVVLVVVVVAVVVPPLFSARIVVSFFAAPGALLAYVAGERTTWS